MSQEDNFVAAFMNCHRHGENVLWGMYLELMGIFLRLFLRLIWILVTLNCKWFKFMSRKMSEEGGGAHCSNIKASKSPMTDYWHYCVCQANLMSVITASTFIRIPGDPTPSTHQKQWDLSQSLALLSMPFEEGKFWNLLK